LRVAETFKLVRLLLLPLLHTRARSPERERAIACVRALWSVESVHRNHRQGFFRGERRRARAPAVLQRTQASCCAWLPAGWDASGRSRLFAWPAPMQPLQTSVGRGSRGGHPAPRPRGFARHASSCRGAAGQRLIASPALARAGPPRCRHPCPAPALQGERPRHLPPVPRKPRGRRRQEQQGQLREQVGGKRRQRSAHQNPGAPLDS
jgi:hypothetical protein